MFAQLLTLVVVVVQLDAAWKDADAVYLSYDVDSIEAAFVPGTGWPEPGGLLPREALKIVGMVAAEGLCGMELVEVSPPYDVSDITALMGLRLIVDVMGALRHPATMLLGSRAGAEVCGVRLAGSLVAHGKMGAHKSIIDKEFTPF